LQIDVSLSFLTNGNRGRGRGENSRGVKLITYLLQLVPRSRKVELYLHSPYILIA
jgi:hypothetical protein